jgi:hypothetical protein
MMLTGSIRHRRTLRWMGMALCAFLALAMTAAPDLRAETEEYVPYNPDGWSFAPGEGATATPHSTYWHNFIAAKAEHAEVGLAEWVPGSSRYHYLVDAKGAIRMKHAKWRSEPECWNADSRTRRIVECVANWSQNPSRATACNGGSTIDVVDYTSAVELLGDPGTTFVPAADPAVVNEAAADWQQYVAAIHMDPIDYLAHGGPPPGTPSAQADPVAIADETYRPSVACGASSPTGTLWGPASDEEAVWATVLADGSACLIVYRSDVNVIGCGRGATGAAGRHSLTLRDDSGQAVVYGVVPSGVTARVKNAEVAQVGRVFVARRDR